MPTTGFGKERPPYVVFVRGTPKSFAAKKKKDSNTLYYISEEEAEKGTLYLGEKIIAGGEKGEKGDKGDKGDPGDGHIESLTNLEIEELLN